MEKDIKFHNVDRLDLINEKKVNQILQQQGVYSKSNIFPIASLQFELTSHCNMFCKHCYNNSGISNTVSDLMTGEKWVEFSNYLVNQGGIFECILSGGEPLLLGERLFEIMDILHNDGTCFMLLTNGFLITDESAKRLRKYRYHWLQISIDGVTAEYHDSFRQRKGSWNKAVEGALKISENKIPLKIAHCVTPYNLQSIDEVCEFAYFLGASCITVGQLCFSGRAAHNKELLLSDTQQKFLYRKVEENIAKYAGKMKVKSSNSVRMGLERHRRNPNSGAIIRPNGDIRIDGMAPFVIGNILLEDFADVWKRKISTCWDNPKVREYIEGFDDNDRNNFYLNYLENDIYI